VDGDNARLALWVAIVTAAQTVVLRLIDVWIKERRRQR
jgi:hypothetical protein